MFIYSVAKTQLRNAPFGTSPRLAARSLSRTGRFFASASRPRCWVVMQGYEVRTCSAAPRFKPVTASLGHSFVPPTWKLIHRVHMTRKTSFCPLGQKLVFSSEACLRHGKRRFAPGRCFAGKYLRKCVARFPSHRAKRDPSLGTVNLHIVRSAILHFALCANLHEKTKRACYSRSRRCI